MDERILGPSRAGYHWPTMEPSVKPFSVSLIRWTTGPGRAGHSDPPLRHHFYTIKTICHRQMVSISQRPETGP